MLERNDIIRDYTLIKFLGKGQFGEVWLAEKQLQFASRKFRHALKFLSNVTNEIDLQNVEAEIDTWIEASGHPNVMSVLDMFAHQEHMIIVSEYAEGGSLHGWLKRPDGKVRSQEKAVKMMLGILGGIEHLHSRNVVHRDLKPDNILLQGNFPRITDFGISRIVSSNSMLTRVVGSPAYMSPESFEGIKSPQTDIWSAGVILHEMLSGKLPFKANTIFGLATAIRNSEPNPLPETVPVELRNIVERALHKKLEDRYPAVGEMRSELERVALDLKISSTRPPPIRERRTNDPGFIDPGARTEPVEDYIGRESIITSSLDGLENPGVLQLIDTQSTRPAIIDATQRTGEPGRDLQTRSENEMAAAGLVPLKRPNTMFSPGPMAAVAGGLAGGGLLQIFAIFLFLSLISRIFVASGFFPSATGKAGKIPTEAPAGAPPIIPVIEAPPDMVFVPGGEFTMGRDAAQIPDDVRKHLDEMPAHKVAVGSFYIDIYEVTNEEYGKFVKETGHKVPPQWMNTYPKGEAKFPVVGVDWDDARAYAEWKQKRLPTEEEWEFAARGKDGFLYPWGNIWESENANIKKDGVKSVGSFPGKSPFGIYDMIGNAWEWTASDFKAYPNGRLLDADGKENLKTIRGNSFGGTKEFATATYRTGQPATGAEAYYSRTGFRCAKDAK